MSIRPDQLLCPVLVGRDDEWGVLRSALDRALRGEVHGVFLRGEAGVGKSRLCRTLLKEARRRGLNPVVGLCAAHDTALPFGAVVDAVRRVFTRVPPDAPPLREALAPTISILASVLPELGTPVGDESPQQPPVQRRRLFDALADTLRAIAALSTPGAPSHGDHGVAPLLLVVEDLHWADESTLDLLQFLLHGGARLDADDDGNGGTSPGSGILVVGTYREECLSGAPALTRALAAILATRVAAEIEVRPLTRSALALFLETTLGHPVAPDVVDAFFERSDGNPFVAEELLQTLAAAGHLDGETGRGDVATLHLPLSLRGAVLERLELLPENARTLLSAAAVAGRSFDLELLAAVTGLDTPTLLPGLRLAVHSGAVEEDPTAHVAMGSAQDRYRFRHALTREVIYDELLAPERRALHAAIARVLEARLAPDPAGGASGDMIEALAYHYRLAGDHAKAASFALQAAEHARTLLSFAEARRHYAEALACLPAQDPARLPLLEALGVLSLALLDVRGAIGYLDAASTLLRTVGLARKAAVVLGEMHHLLWFVDPTRFRAMVAELDAVAEAARTSADGVWPEDADALMTYAAAALAHAGYATYTRADLWAQRALDLAATLQRVGVLSTITPAPYKALLARGHGRINGAIDVTPTERQALIEAGLHDFQEALEMGLRHTLPEIVQLSYNFLPRALLDLGRDAAASELLDQSDAYARRSGVAAIADTRGYSLLYAGRLEEGVAAMREAAAASRAAGVPAKMALELAALGHLLVARGDGPGAAAALEEALAIVEPSNQFVAVAPCLAGLGRVRAILRDEDGAAALFARVQALWRGTQDRVEVVPLLLEGALFHAARGDARRAGDWADDLGRIAHGTPTPVAAAAALHARGAALNAAGDHAAARESLREAVAAWTALARPYHAARARGALGAALLAAIPRDGAQRAEADAALQAAVDTFTRLGAAYDAALVTDVRRRSGLLSQARRRQSLAERRAPFGDLTPREREVLILLADGLTNREIAHALFIAEGTAELHVSRILSKLGCTTRAQAAAYAVANRLVEAP